MILSVTGKFLWNIFLRLEQLGLDPDTIIIEGNSMVSGNRIRAILDLEYGQNILSIKTKELEKKLEALSRIKSVRIKRNFPDSLNIYIEEVRPAGYLIKNNKRYVVTFDGNIFPGLEGPAVELKVNDPEKIKRLTALLWKIGEIDEKFHNSIIAVDCNYRDEVIIFRHDCYIKWQVISEIDEVAIKRNIYLLRKVIKEYQTESRSITYLDFRFIDFDDGKVKGAIIVK